MRTFLRYSDWLFITIAAIASVGFMVCVIVQVFYRYVLAAPLPWTEELARYLFVWTALLAAAVSVGRNEQFNIPMFADVLGDEARRWLEVFIAILGIVFACLMVWYGWKMSDRLMGAMSPVLPVGQGYVYLILPISGTYMVVHLLWRLKELLQGHISGKGSMTW
jgi:TRAP-type C4-dicarboxylate transport system permease small subunit